MSLDGMAIFGDKDAVTVSKPGDAEVETKTCLCRLNGVRRDENASTK